MGLVLIGHQMVPPPAGVDATTMEGLARSIHLFEPKHFLFPFLAHAGGTFIGALVAAALAGSHKLKLALLVGLFFLAGGLVNALVLPGPPWFTAVDLLLAYLPPAWFAGGLAEKKRQA